MNKLFTFLFIVSVTPTFGQKKIAVQFENISNNNIININDTLVGNCTITKLKYYVSNVNFITNQKIKPKQNVHLIDANKTNYIKVKVPIGKIIGISFLLGVDSVFNYSGPQQGVLDPLNDMFWTWNNGYVVFKVEGFYNTMPTSKLELHIGGYKGVYKAQRQIYIPIKNCIDTITVQMNIDKILNTIAKSEPKIITSPGPKAKLVADNFEKMFTIKNEN